MTTPTNPLVLLVEDDPDIAMLFKAFMVADGLEVSVCTSAAEALRWWQASVQTPDLLVMDVRLPDGNGLDLCRSIMDLADGKPMPRILILSAHGDPRLPAACQKAGGVFLDKLTDQAIFMDTVRRLLAEGLLIESA